eukprot:CAMPEP_0182840570 /NCGR_PEP_ID=MMETSP0006_2-20121128/24530_1 /TAXON_ID=97485 /ORGANISM="Prymnesium parvum, Strain Texoma1" /LENGTH=62 /DNA_ID=CAMNT_0024969915 /DNA_START=39 /DNA_END=224 /DNA_ORIENTATION=-
MRVEVVCSPASCASPIVWSHCAVVSLSGQISALTWSDSTSAAVPGSEPSPASRSRRRYSPTP